jgi:hypothetical protein
VHGGDASGPRAGGLQLGGDVEEVVLAQAAGGELDPDRQAVVVDAEWEGDRGAFWPRASYRRRMPVSRRQSHSSTGRSRKLKTFCGPFD